MVHCIDDEETFPRGFGMDIAAGMMDLPPSHFGRKEARPSFEQERAATLKYSEELRPFLGMFGLD